MDSQKFEMILKRLLELSEEENLNWKTTADQNTFLLALKGSSISIETDFAEDYGGNIFILQFRNERGEVVESMPIFGDSIYFKSAEQLFGLARSKALNSDKTIDRILEQLSSPDSVMA